MYDYITNKLVLHRILCRPEMFGQFSNNISASLAVFCLLYFNPHPVEFISEKKHYWRVSFIYQRWGGVGNRDLQGRQWPVFPTYRKTPNISRTLVGDKIDDNSDVVGASPVGAAPTTSSFST